MSRTRKFLGGISFGYLNQFLVALAGLWLTPFLLKMIGQSTYGLWLVATQIMAYLLLMDLGVIAILPREVAYLFARSGLENDWNELGRLLGTTKKIVLAQTPLVALASLAIWFLMPADWEPLRYPLAAVLCAFVILFPFRIFHGVLQGVQDLAFLARLQIVGWALGLIVTVLLVLAGFGLYALAIGWIAGQVLSSFFWWFRTRRSFQRLSFRTNLDGWEMARSQLGRGIWVNINQIGQILLSGADILIIGKLFGPAAVVPYVCTGKLANVLANQPQLLIHTAGPALAEMRAVAARERLAEICTALSQGVLMISGLLFAVVLSVNDDFVRLWVGPNLYAGFGVTICILLAMMVRHWNVTVAYTVFTFGHERRLAVTGLADGVVTFVAAIALIRTLGIIGAPIGSLIGVCLVSLPANLLALGRDTGVTLSKTLRELWPWFIRFVFVAAAAAAMPGVFNATNLLEVALICAGVSIVYGLLMFSIAIRSPLGEFFLERLPARYSQVLRSLA
ncbi:MAG: oligosaccharide flippase family protein [Acidobacteriota bacterium]